MPIFFLAQILEEKSNEKSITFFSFLDLKTQNLNVTSISKTILLFTTNLRIQQFWKILFILSQKSLWVFWGHAANR